MREGTYKFIVQMLNDYNDIDKHINKRIQEITYPVAIPDDNAGIKSPYTTTSPTERLAVTILDDKLISSLNHNKAAIDKVLNRLEPKAKQVIYMYYIDRDKRTWEGVAMETKYSEKQCRNIRNAVFEEIAKEMGMPL